MAHVRQSIRQHLRFKYKWPWPYVGPLMSTEMKGRVVWGCRARGFEIQKLGHTIEAVFDPSADSETDFLRCSVYQ